MTFSVRALFRREFLSPHGRARRSTGSSGLEIVDVDLVLDGVDSLLHSGEKVVNLNSAVEIAAREHKEHKDSRFNDATAGLILHQVVETRNALAVSSNAFVYALFAFSRGHAIAAARVKPDGMH